MPTVLGAGSVGLVLGARLALAGAPVRFVTRSEESARHLVDDGVRIEDPATGETWRARVRATVGPEAGIGRGPVYVCVRGPDTEAAASALAEAAPDATVVSVQNGVESEAVLARRFAKVVGAVWRQTCTRIGPAEARATGRARMVVGRWPEGGCAAVDELADGLRRADLDVGVSTRIQEDLWLKLCVNLMSAPNALVRRPDHGTRAFAEAKARLLEEARDALAAAGIPARSCDGRDRSLDEEIAWQREAFERGTGARDLPLYNHVWTGLRSRSHLESGDYHRLILTLARRAGLAAPVNERVLAVLEETWRQGRGPEGAAARDLLPD